MLSNVLKEFILIETLLAFLDHWNGNFEGNLQSELFINDVWVLWLAVCSTKILRS